MIRKLVVGNGRSEREILLVGNITIGRDPACHVSEPDPLLSRRHAEIIANVHGVSVRDLDSRNGILVNGEKTREQVLRPGDIVQMGHLQLRYVEEQPRAADPVPPRRIEHQHPAATSAAPYDLDRFRPEPPPAQPRPSAQVTPQPGRWKPEPTPLPGRRSSAPPPPPLQPRPPQQPGAAVPRGRAAFDDSEWVPRHQGGAEPLDHTRVASHDTTLGGPVDLDATMLAPTAPVRNAAGHWLTPASSDATMVAGDVMAADPDAIGAPGDTTFAAALSHLAGIVTPLQEQLPPSADTGARLIANAELTITDASPRCADLLGVPGETLVGGSLADVFLRGVRRAYAEPDLALTFSVARGPRGSITVTLMLDNSTGHA